MSNFERGDFGEAPVILYKRGDGKKRIEVRIADETVWLTQQQLSELFQTSVPNINMHIKNIYDEGELQKSATVQDFLIVRSEGGRDVQRSTMHYNLEMIIAVGFRVNSKRGTLFRQWANERLNEYLVKGFTMDDERLREVQNIGSDYFDELLERIRDIRASEKRFYAKIRDLYALAIDYDSSAETTRTFFQVVQNKMHYAVSGKTAAELISERADASKPNMGLTAWKGEKVRKGDVTVAKNYLNASEMSEMNRIVTMFLDYAEDQAARGRPIYMADWKKKLDSFLQFNERDILDNPGKVTKAVADALAKEEYKTFHSRRLKDEALAADQEFEKVVKKVEQKKNKS